MSSLLHDYYLMSENGIWLPLADVESDGIKLLMKMPVLVEQANTFIINELHSLENKKDYTSSLSQRCHAFGQGKFRIFVFLLGISCQRHYSIYTVAQYAEQTDNLRILVFGSTYKSHNGPGSDLSKIRLKEIDRVIFECINIYMDNDLLEKRLISSDLQISELMVTRIKKRRYIMFI